MPFEVVNRQIKNTRAEILAELQHSFEKNNAIGILVKDTNELITTAVVDIESDSETGDYTIHLMDYDLHGYPIDRNRLLLSNIDRVIHFNVPFNDPLYEKERRKEKFKI
jgi:hypothetical protein